MVLKFTRLYASDTVATSGTRKFRKLVSTLESGGQIITFTIAGTTYQAESGMTWGEWVESEYNTAGFKLEYHTSFMQYTIWKGDRAVGYNGVLQFSTETIKADVAYGMFNAMHGGGSN